MVIAQANGEVNWVGIVVLGLLALLALCFVASKFRASYEEEGSAGVIGCITTIIIIIVIRALIIYFRENG